ncbi:hypothetical protein IWX47DRAFT_918075 [Phyllosticta citricarpa]
MSSSPGHSTPGRKRTGRACDHCYLQQKRCDNNPDRRDAPCSRCRQHGIECSYNRVAKALGRPSTQQRRDLLTQSPIPISRAGHRRAGVWKERRPTPRTVLRRSLRIGNASSTTGFPPIDTRASGAIDGQKLYEPTTPRLALTYDNSISATPSQTPSTRVSASRAGSADQEQFASKTPRRILKNSRDASPTIPPIRVAACTTSALRPAGAKVPAQRTLDGWLKKTRHEENPDIHGALEKKKAAATGSASEKNVDVDVMDPESSGPSSGSHSNRSSHTVLVDELTRASSFSSSHGMGFISDAATSSFNAEESIPGHQSNAPSQTLNNEPLQVHSFSSHSTPTIENDFAADAAAAMSSFDAAADPEETRAFELLTNLQASGCIDWDRFHFMNGLPPFCSLFPSPPSLVGLEEHGPAAVQQQQQHRIYGGGEANVLMVDAALGGGGGGQARGELECDDDLDMYVDAWRQHVDASGGAGGAEQMM